jgi:hypothetical protein
MKRDVDLSRAILRFVEEHAPPQGGVQKPLEIEGYDRPTILAHAELLIEDGLLDGRVSKGLGGPVNIVIIKLTWPSSSPTSGTTSITRTSSDTASNSGPSCGSGGPSWCSHECNAEGR